VVCLLPTELSTLIDDGEAKLVDRFKSLKTMRKEMPGWAMRALIVVPGGLGQECYGSEQLLQISIGVRGHSLHSSSLVIKGDSKSSRCHIAEH
jgi:hypothetical protein